MRNTLVSLGMTLCLVTGCSVGVADPNIQVPGTDDGTPNCGPFPELFFSRLYIGGPVGSSTAIDESFHAPPTTTFCNANIGFSSETYGPEGVRLTIPRTEDGPFHNNAELLAIPAFEPGQRMVYELDGTDVTTLNGTLGFGVSNRTLDLGALEIAWFMYNWTGNGMGEGVQPLRPLLQLLGTDLPTGLFMLVKRAGELVPQIVRLDSALLATPHAWAVDLTDRDAVFQIDGVEVGRFGRPPTGTARDFTGAPLPLVGQIWIDAAFWFPLPLPQYNAASHSVLMKRYVQGPIGSTPARPSNG